MLAYERVWVRDPTAMCKIALPGRSIGCKHAPSSGLRFRRQKFSSERSLRTGRHLQCFDLRTHIQEAYRQRAHWSEVGGPPRDAPTTATLVTCPISSCALEVDVSKLVIDEYFGALLGELQVRTAAPTAGGRVLRAEGLGGAQKQSTDAEYVDIDVSKGTW